MTTIHRPARLATRAASFRYGGRHHSGIPGGIIPLHPGGFLGIGINATATLESHWFSAIKSIQTPAVIAVRDDFYRGYPAVAGKIRQAAEDALPAIAARAGARPDWAQDFERH